MSNRNAGWRALLVLLVPLVSSTYVNYQLRIGCSAVYRPELCENLMPPSMATIDDFERCGPARLVSLENRNYFWGVAGKGVTNKANSDAFGRIEIIPRALRDVSRTSLETTILGERIAFPVGLADVPALNLVSATGGETQVAAAAMRARTVMIVSALSTTPAESLRDIMRSVDVSNGQPTPILWLQTFFFNDTADTMRVVRSANDYGFQAIVVNANSPGEGTTNCQNKVQLGMQRFPILNTNYNPSKLSASLSFNNITWLRRYTTLPIIVKGIMNGQDAVRAIQAGARGVIVSNSGGRQLDGAPATIDVLPQVVNALRQPHPRAEVYLDGGVKSGADVYKALARGARAVFIGRPYVWGLTYGEEGVTRVLTILRNELNETMRLAGVSRVSDIRINSIYPRNRPVT